MHNGQISSFGLLKRTLLGSLNDDMLNFPQGQTDSEWAFALFLSHLDRPDRQEPFEWKELKEAMDKTIQCLNRWAKDRGVKEVSGRVSWTSSFLCGQLIEAIDIFDYTAVLDELLRDRRSFYPLHTVRLLAARRSCLALLFLRHELLRAREGSIQDAQGGPPPEHRRRGQ